jgi:hypothetical protein
MRDPAARATRFVASHEGVEGVTMRIGARSAELVLVAGSGAWFRSVVASTDAAHTLGERIGVPVADGWTDETRRRMTSWRRPARMWARAPYPERAPERLADV